MTFIIIFRNFLCRKDVEYFFILGLFLNSIQPINNQDGAIYIDEEIRAVIKKLGKDVAKLTSGKKNTDMLPTAGQDYRMELLTEVYVEDMSSFNAKDMDFRMELFLKHVWKVDEDVCDKYEFSLFKLNLNLSQSSPLYLSPLYFYLFWIPDTYFTNAKKVDAVTKETNTKVLVVLKDKGSCKLELVSRLALTVACQMNFKFYPVDVQECPLTMRSYAYPNSMLVYKWENETEVPMNNELILLQHTVTFSKGVGIRILLERTYSTIYLNIIFKRQLTYFLSNVYAPSGLIIVISSFSFWMGVDIIPGRISLCVTCILALVTQMSGLRNTLPQVSYITYLDIWMITCLMFVFSSLLEFTVIWFLDKMHKDKVAKETTTEVEEKLTDKNKNQLIAPKYCTCNNIEKGRREMTALYHSCIDAHGRKHRRLMTPPSRQSWIEEEEEEQCCPNCNCLLDGIMKVDKAARIIFPLLFIIFNTIYWPLLLSNYK